MLLEIDISADPKQWFKIDTIMQIAFIEYTGPVLRLDIQGFSFK